MNDVNAIAEILPRMPTILDWAVIRSGVDSGSPRELTYQPYNVVQALLWLENNNPLWGGKFKRPLGSHWDDRGTHERTDTEIIPGKEIRQISDSNSTCAWLDWSQRAGIRF